MSGSPDLREKPHLQRELGLAHAPPLTPVVLSDPAVELAVRLLQLGGRAGRLATAVCLPATRLLRTQLPLLLASPWGSPLCDTVAVP